MSFKDLKPEALLNYVHYCRCTEVEREVLSETLESPLTTLTGSWTMITELGPTSGLMFRERSVKSHVRHNIENKNQHIVVIPQDVVQTRAFPEVETVAQ